jgi:lipopolysaccharide export system permease protein
LEADLPKGYKKERRHLIRVLDKLIIQDLLKTMLSVLMVIVVIIVSRKFIRILDDAISGQVSNETLLSILGLKTIVASVEFLPVALFMAVLMVLGRMYRDQEMSAISSAGGGSGTIYRAVFLLVFPLSVLALGLSLYATPWAEARVDKLMQQGEESADLRGIAAGKFSEYSQGDLVFYVEKITADKKMHNVFVQNRQHGKVAIITAESAQLKDSPDGRYIIFEQGEQVQGQPGTLNYVIEQFTEYAVRIETKTAAATFNRQAVPADKLWGSDTTLSIAELQRRFSIPLGALLLAFVAVPLAQIAPRGGVYGNMLVGFLIYFSYGNLVRINESWVINGKMPAWLGGISVNLLLLLMGGFLLARLYGWRWLAMKIKGKVS